MHKEHRWLKVIKSAARWGVQPSYKRRRGMSGQALVEYVLIGVLVAIAIGAAITLTGPAIGNIFSNTIYNVLGQTTTPYATLNVQTVNYYKQAVASFTFVPFAFQTNTPAAPTCASGPGGVWKTAVGNQNPEQPTYQFC